MLRSDTQLLKRRLTFMIHDLHPWGGQDQSTLEIIRRLKDLCSIDVYVFSVRGIDTWKRVFFHYVRPNIRRPVILKSFIFYCYTFVSVQWSRLFKKGVPLLIHSTGTCSWISHIIHVQFIHSAWDESRGPSNFRQSSWVRCLYHQIELKFNIFMERLLYDNHKKYIALSHRVENDLQRLFKIKKENITVIYHGVDSHRFKPLMKEKLQDERMRVRRQLGLKEDCMIILFVGAPERKGLETAIHAIKLLSEEGLKNFVLIGVGIPNGSKYFEMGRQLGIGDFLSFMPPSQEVKTLYPISDLFLLPTLYEPFGLVCLEAMACGLPSIFSRCAGAAELVVAGESALLIEDPLSVIEVKDHLKALLLNESLRERMGIAARKVAESRSWEQVSQEYEALLSPLVFHTTPENVR